MSENEQSVIITTRVAGRRRNLATPKQWRAAIASGQLSRETVVVAERAPNDPEEIAAEQVPELAALFEEMLGPKPAPMIEPAPEATSRPEETVAPTTPDAFAPEPARQAAAAQSRAEAPLTRPAARQPQSYAREPGYPSRTSADLSALDYMVLPLKKYAQFTGRSRRSEFWWFQLAVLGIIFLGALVIAGGGGEGVAGLLGLAWLGVLIPSLAVSVRRLHDINLSGWWMVGMGVGSFIPVLNVLVSIAWFVLMLMPSHNGANRYGPNPKEADAANTFA